MEIQVCSNEGQCPFPRGDNNIIVEIHLPSLKNLLQLSSEPLGKVQQNLAQSILGWKELKVLQIQDHSILKKKIMFFSSPNQYNDIFHSIVYMCLLIWYLGWATWPMGLSLNFLMPYSTYAMHTTFGIDLPKSSWEKMFTNNGQRLTHNNRRQPIAIGHLWDQDALEITP